jgi:FkbM family methyltransferase
MKRFARALLPMGLYRRLARLHAYACAWREGPVFLGKMACGEGAWTHRFRALEHPFTFRLTDEDKNVVFGNIIKREVLAGPLPSDARFIVDAGGYIGDTAAVFLSRYPRARCFVLEPGQAHAWAATNLGRYGARAVLHQAALMGAVGGYRVVEADTASQVVPAAQGEVKALTMADVLAASPHGRIDILKVDIEGAEVALFRAADDWLGRVDCVTIELHGAEAKAEIPPKLRAAGFQVTQHGSLTVAVRPTTSSFR